LTNLTNSKKRWFLESLASPVPMVEKPWQGGPPQIISIFLLLIFFLNSLIEIFLMLPSLPIAFFWFFLTQSMQKHDFGPRCFQMLPNVSRCC